VGTIRYGTSSWSTAGWVGPFYPQGMKPGDFLAHYATCFDTVEADVTYYRVPSRSMVEGWARKTPPGFTLSAKFPRSIVHAGKGPRPNPDALLVPEVVARDTQVFLENMALLGDKLGPLVLQFPYFNRQVFASPEPFLERLDAYLEELPSEVRVAVEVRNKTWIDEPLLDLLRGHGAALVLVDLAYMPHPALLAERFDLVTGDFAYCRLIGDRKAVDAQTKTFDRIVLDRSDRLEEWATLLRSLAGRVAETYAYANNHYAGHGPATARQLAERVEEQSGPTLDG
jgi:uncharacterized protein YecE (DUF72 family)